MTFTRHYTQAVPCGPGRASLLTGLYVMNHRAVQNTIPLSQRFTNLAHELRRGGYDPALVGYTTTTPDPRHTAPGDPRFFVLGDIMDGFHSVGAFENRDAYFGWVAGQGFQLPKNRDDVWLPQGAPGDETGAGATARPAVIPKELSDTAWFTERGLSYLFITHNIGVVEYIADEVAVMQSGRIVEAGSTEAVLGSPQEAYTRSLLAAVPRLPAYMRQLA